MTYHAITGSIIIKPKSEPIFSEKATTVRLADELAGLFLEIEQEYGEGGKQVIGINVEEWDAIKTAVETMINVIKEVECGNSGREGK